MPPSKHLSVSCVLSISSLKIDILHCGSPRPFKRSAREGCETWVTPGTQGHVPRVSQGRGRGRMDVDPTWRGQDEGGRCLTGSALAGKIQPFCIQVSHSAPCSVLIGSLSPGDWRLTCSPGWPCLPKAQDISSHQTCSKVGTQKGQGTAPPPLGQWFTSL